MNVRPARCPRHAWPARDRPAAPARPRRVHTRGARGLALGGFVLAASSGVEAVVIGVWLAGVGANYAALAVHGLSFEGGEALRRALDGVDVERELRSYALRQLVVAIPFWVAGLAIGQA